MTMKRLTPADYRTMPWKNAGGSTTELVIRPEGGSVSERFRFRVSIAEVNASGPFSAFPGADRHLVVIGGAGMVLQVGAKELPLEPFQPVFFSGDEPTTGALVNGPVRDFNVIVDRERLTAMLSVQRLSAPLSLACGAGGTNVVHVLEGALEGASTGDTLVLEAAHALTPVSGTVRVVLAQVMARA